MMFIALRIAVDKDYASTGRGILYETVFAWIKSNAGVRNSRSVEFAITCLNAIIN